MTLPYIIIAILSCALTIVCILYGREIQTRKKNEATMTSQLIQLRQDNTLLNETLNSLIKQSGDTLVDTKEQESKISPRESRLISNINNIVEERFTNPEFGVDQLAEALDLSRSSLNRKMRELLNTTANHYIRDIRIAKAEELLKNSSLQINEICYKVGFQTPSYFIKCFREKFGMSPNEYANSNYR